MTDLLKCAGILLLYLFLFWNFGKLITSFFHSEKISTGLTLILGFFGYYVLFQVVTIPMMFTMQSLKKLTVLWSITATVICILSIRRNIEWWKYNFHKIFDKKGKNNNGNSESKECQTETDMNNITMENAEDLHSDIYPAKKNIINDISVHIASVTDHNSQWWNLLIIIVALFNLVIVSSIYSSYWDATYYVGTVSYSVYSNTINTYNPLSGLQWEELDLKHCLATYHMNDAVFCQLFNVHPLIQTKTIMVIVITCILNLVYYQFAQFFFPESKRKRAMFMGFCLLVNLCTYSAYTASSFILLRTYEGKAVTGAIVSVMLLYWFLRLFEEDKKFYWAGLFLTAWGAVAISSSAIFMVLAGVGVFTIVYTILQKSWRMLLRGFICMIPAALMLSCYLLNRMGILSIYVS